ncbi:MAG: hypothetical protein RLZZ292_1535 [Bacteroidota bacterium]|jgi:1-aminocyclopropane-1-carboxylate deaminase/D-cysteine desulfhydrase-like pyridoxal-dependent ACC family enzyme
MSISLLLPSPIVEIQEKLLLEKEIRLFVKREELIHPTISGNKWRKLKYNIQQAISEKKTFLVTKGGAFSNHIFSTAAAGKYYNLNTVGIIRGEEVENSTLAFAKACGMRLIFISRSDYRDLDESKALTISALEKKNAYYLHEGGTNLLALKGCREVIDEVRQQFKPTELPDFFCVASGTGGTAAGMILGLQNEKKLIAFSALKGDFLKKDIETLLQEANPTTTFTNWQLQTDYHFGGYAKMPPELLYFIAHFQAQHDILLEPIYTGKLLYGVLDLIANDFFPRGSRILAVHTGGLRKISNKE